MRNLLFRHFFAIEWLAFFGLILVAWTVLFAMQPGSVDPELARLYGADFWAALCAPLTGQSNLLVIFLMWALMSGAMMAPTFVPTLSTYRDLTHTDAANRRTMVALLVGYFAVWIGFSAIAALVQLSLARVGFVGADGASLNWGLTAVLLLAAGLYQFSATKDACLAKCRAPFTFFMGNWTPRSVGALKMGAQLGVICLGCCWVLMSLGFIGGVMNLIWMGIATVLMVVEKLPEIGRYVTKPLGIGLLAAGVFASLNVFGI